MLRLYGSDLSVFSNKIKFTAHVLGIEYEFHCVNLREREHQKPEFLKIHPAGKVPVIDDDGFVLFESGAVIKYLANKKESDLYPKDIKQRALVDQWIDFSTLHISNALNKVIFNRIFAPRMGRPVDEQSLKDGMMFLNRFLPIVEQQLSENAYLAGEKFSLADITLLSALDPAEVAEIDISRYPAIVKWRNVLKQKDFYKSCHEEYGTVLK